MTRPDAIIVRGRTKCYCGQRIGAPGHNRGYCLTWRDHDPAPGGGFPAVWQVPERLYQESEPAKVSLALERYLDFWSGRYVRALLALERRSPDQHRTYLAVLHDGEKPGALAKAWGVSPAVVRQWKRRAIVFIRERVGDAVAWEASERLTLPLDVRYDPSDLARVAEREELKRLNARPVEEAA